MNHGRNHLNAKQIMINCLCFMGTFRSAFANRVVRFDGTRQRDTTAVSETMRRNDSHIKKRTAAVCAILVFHVLIFRVVTRVQRLCYSSTFQPVLMPHAPHACFSFCYNDIKGQPYLKRDTSQQTPVCYDRACSRSPRRAPHKHLSPSA